MRVFVTGATGFVGSAVVRELLGAGHSVLGLARSDAAADALAAEGAEVHRGDLEDLDSVRAGAAGVDGVIHTAFNHDFSRYRDNCAADRRVIEALGDALAGSGRPLVVTSGVGILPPGRLLTEDMAPPTGPSAAPRAASEEAAAAAAARGLRVAVVRLAPSVHGAGDHGFVPLLIRLAREKGLSAYVGEGANRWPGVQRLDAARLYRSILETPGAAGNFHGVDEEGVPFRAIAEAIGRGLGLPTRSLEPEAAAAHFGWFAHFAALDCPSSNRRTREVLGWTPREPGLLAELAGPAYFPG